MKQRALRLAVLVGLILLGFALRLYNINRVSLRGDEAFTVIHWMREPLSHTLAEIATVDPQPPLAYMLYRGWALVVGSTEYVVRFLPALLNLIGIPVLYALGKRFGGWQLGLIAAFLWSIHPAQIWHAQDARNYGIWGALSPLALWLALRAIPSRRPLDWVLYVLVASVACYVYYLELFFVVSLNVYVFLIFRRDRGILARWVSSQLVLGLVLVPWYLQERLLFSSGYGGTASRFDPVQLLSWFVPSLAVGDTSLLASRLWPLVCLLVVLGLYLLWRVRGQQAVLLALLGTLPLLFLGLVSLRLNVFVPRYVLSVSVVYVLVLAALVWLLFVRRASFVAGFVVVMCVVFFADGLIGYFVSDYTKSPDWRALVAYLQTRVEPDAAVVQRSADMAFNFYYREYVRDDEPFQLPANPRQSAQEIENVLASQRVVSYWIVAQPPDWDNASIPSDWLSDYTQKVRDVWVDDIHVEQYMPWEVNEIETQSLAMFGDAVELVGSETSTEMYGTPSLNVWLYWRALETTDSPLKVFVHLIGETNPAAGTPLWAQDDDFPQSGRISTTNWTVGQLYRDVYTLSLANIPSGSYQVVIGLYDPVTGIRVPVGNTDSYSLATINLP
jgi:mannosyltransferase